MFRFTLITLVAVLAVGCTASSKVRVDRTYGEAGNKLTEVIEVEQYNSEDTNDFTMADTEEGIASSTLAFSRATNSTAVPLGAQQYAERAFANGVSLGLLTVLGQAGGIPVGGVTSFESPRGTFQAQPTMTPEETREAIAEAVAAALAAEREAAEAAGEVPE